METLFQEFLSLSAFSGERPEGFRRLHQFFADRYGQLGVAILMVQDLEPGSAKLVALMLENERVELDLNDPFLESATLYNDALTQAVLGEGPAVHSLDQTQRNTRFGRHLDQACTLAASPIAVDGKVHHWIILFSSEARRFDALDSERLMLEVNLAAHMLRGAMALRVLRAAAQRQQHEIDSLANVQRLLLPPEEPDIRGVEISVHYQPAEIAAGDYYDIMSLSHYFDDCPSDSDVWGVMVADVSGHGPAAAMEAAMFDAILRTYQTDNAGTGPGDLMTYANRFFFTRRVRPHFLTAFGGNYHPGDRTLNFASAGHPNPLLLRNGKLVPIKQGAGIPLGVVKESSWATESIQLHKGDALIVFTDGVVEATNAAGEQFGIQGLSNAVTQGGTSAQSIRDRTLTSLFNHQGGAIGNDDQTLIVLHQVA